MEDVTPDTLRSTVILVPTQYFDFSGDIVPILHFFIKLSLWARITAHRPIPIGVLQPNIDRKYRIQLSGEFRETFARLLFYKF